MAAASLFAQKTGIWIDVPYIKQSPEGCGAASLAMVMQYWEAKSGRTTQQSSTPACIFEQLHSPKSHGIYASAMESYLKEHGFESFAFPGTWDDIGKHLGKGRPLIVAIKPSDSGKSLHYVVVAGVDSEAGLVMFNDPAGRKLTKLDRRTFEKEWEASGKWTLLALPQQSGH